MRRQHLKSKILPAVLLATALVATGCSSRGGTETPAAPATSAPAGFDLKGICQAGTSTSAPTQGVTATEIKVGVMSDVGFTKNSEFADAAKVFTSWCNDAGGINGRKITATTRDSALMNVRQQILAACDSDFALVGGGSALDALGVADRLGCLLPDFPAQVSQIQNAGSDLQVNLNPGSATYFPYAGYARWLLKEAYPGSAGALGVIAGDSPVAKVIVDQNKEGFTAAGGTYIYSDVYPPQGVSDWTPYAQNLKAKGVKGLQFIGDFLSLSKLEQVLTSIGYKLDWIDANSNAYGPAFIQLAGPSATAQNNLADLSGFFPIENAASNPATKAALDLFAKYAPDAKVTLPALKAMSAWLLFAKSAASCGDALTRTCVYNAARKETAWTGLGLNAPMDLSSSSNPAKCFNVEKATATGWQPADFKPDTGAYRCDTTPYKYTGSYGKPITLADVGKSMSDVK
jgi:ABC-type branched-subunit amino acid transport system substrate-binding protein